MPPRESRKSGGSEIVDDHRGDPGPPKESRKSGGGSEIVDDQRVALGISLATTRLGAAPGRIWDDLEIKSDDVWNQI